MGLEFIFLGGYGLYVWVAFIFTFASCFFLYVKTKKELQRQEKFFFSVHGRFQAIKIATAKQKETAKQSLSASSTF